MIDLILWTWVFNHSFVGSIARNIKYDLQYVHMPITSLPLLQSVLHKHGISICSEMYDLLVPLWD